VYGTMASQFNGPGMNRLYRALMELLVERSGAALRSTFEISAAMSEKTWIIPPERTRYLAEIAEACEGNDGFVRAQAALARRMYQLHGTIEALRAMKEAGDDLALARLRRQNPDIAQCLDPDPAQAHHQERAPPGVSLGADHDFDAPTRHGFDQNPIEPNTGRTAIDVRVQPLPAFNQGGLTIDIEYDSARIALVR